MKKKYKIYSIGILMAAVVTAGIIILASVSITPNVETIRVWQTVYRWTPVGAEGDPGTGASGFIEIIFLNISSTDGNGYGFNTSTTLEGWADANMPGCSPNAWANADDFDLESFESEKTFVFWVKTRFNKTHAWESTKFIDTDCDVQITVSCTSWAVGSNIANVSGTPYISRNDTSEDFIWITWVWDNSGTGYQVSNDAVLTTSEIYIEAKF